MDDEQTALVAFCLLSSEEQEQLKAFLAAGSLEGAEEWADRLWAAYCRFMEGMK